MGKTVVGFGFDSHLFGKKGPLTLGGLELKGVPALKGHSDGDALIHALIDALLGAAALGDIGEMFSDQDKKWKGASSVMMLKKAWGRVAKKGFRLGNVDLMVLADRPKLQPLKGKIIKKLSQALMAPSHKFNLKGKTQEGLALFKRPGGIAVWAVVTLQKK